MLNHISANLIIVIILYLGLSNGYPSENPAGAKEKPTEVPNNNKHVGESQMDVKSMPATSPEHLIQSSKKVEAKTDSANGDNNANKSDARLDNTDKETHSNNQAKSSLLVSLPPTVEKSNDESQVHGDAAVVSGNRGPVQEDSFPNSYNSKCSHVRCERPPPGKVCTELSQSDAKGFAHSDCCSVHLCQREDGSQYYHYGIEVEQAPGQSAQPMPFYPSSMFPTRPSFKPNNGEFLRVSNYQSPFLPSAAAASPQFRQPSFPFRQPNQPYFLSSGAESKSPASNYNFNPMRPAVPNPQTSASSAQSRPGFFYPSSFPRFANQGQASAQSSNRFVQGSSSANNFSPVQFAEQESFALDRPVRNAAPASPFPVAQGAFPLAQQGAAPLQGSWSRFKRNVFGALQSDLNTPLRPAVGK